MTDGFLEERRQALEESFFHKRNADLMRQHKSELEREARRKKLSTVSGIVDEQLLNRFIDLDMEADPVAALALVPLVRVAWADDKLEPKELEAILQAAVDAGIEKGSASFRCLQTWLAQKPDDELNDAWQSYVQALSQQLSVADREAMQIGLITRARHVAEAAGGLLGLGNKVSDAEQEVLNELANAFG